MVTRAFFPKKPIDHNTDEKRSNHSMNTEKTIVTKSKQFHHTGCQYQMQTVPVFSNPKKQY